MRRTQATLQAALIELVAEQDLPRISIADVAERAGVSRSTFYDHYQDVHQLAEAACTAMIDRLIASIPTPNDVFDGRGRGVAEALRAFFAAFGEHANLYRSLLGPQGSALIIDHIRRRVTAGIYASTRLPDHAVGDMSTWDTVDTAHGPHDVPAAFAAGALIGTAVDWLQHDSPTTPTELAARTSPLFMTLYGLQRNPSAD